MQPSLARTGRPGTLPPVRPPGAAGAGSCVRSEKGLLVVVIVVGAVVLVGDASLALAPQPAVKTSAAALPHHVIAFLPL
jgi:hypothetical protein